MSSYPRILIEIEIWEGHNPTQRWWTISFSTILSRSGHTKLWKSYQPLPPPRHNQNTPQTPPDSPLGQYVTFSHPWRYVVQTKYVLGRYVAEKKYVLGRYVSIVNCVLDVLFPKATLHNVNFCTLWSLCKIVNCKLCYFQCTLWTFEHLAEHAEGPFQVCVCWYSTNLSWIMTSQCSLSLRIIHLHCSLLEAISSAGSFRHLDTTCKWFYTSKPFAHCTVCSSLFGFKRCPR